MARLHWRHGKRYYGLMRPKKSSMVKVQIHMKENQHSSLPFKDDGGCIRQKTRSYHYRERWFHKEVTAGMLRTYPCHNIQIMRHHIKFRISIFTYWNLVNTDITFQIFPGSIKTLHYKKCNIKQNCNFSFHFLSMCNIFVELLNKITMRSLWLQCDVSFQKVLKVWIHTQV